MSHLCHFRIFTCSYSGNALCPSFTTTWIWTSRLVQQLRNLPFEMTSLSFSPPALSPAKSLEKFSWDVWRFWNGTGMTCITSNESYMPKKSRRAPEDSLVWQWDRALPQSLQNLEALRPRGWQNLEGHLRCQDICCPLLCKHYILGHEVESLGCIYSLCYSFVHPTNIYCLPAVCRELGIQLRIFFLAS